MHPVLQLRGWQSCLLSVAQRELLADIAMPGFVPETCLCHAGDWQRRPRRQDSGVHPVLQLRRRGAHAPHAEAERGGAEHLPRAAAVQHGLPQPDGKTLHPEITVTSRESSKIAGLPCSPAPHSPSGRSAVAERLIFCPYCNVSVVPLSILPHMCLPEALQGAQAA